MIEVKHYGSGERTRVYECTPKREIELCLANIECLLNIALLDNESNLHYGDCDKYKCTTFEDESYINESRCFKLRKKVRKK